MNEKLGETRLNKQGTMMKIVRYGSYTDIDVEFMDDFHYIKEHQAYVNFKNGGIKNPYDRTTYGIGYLGDGIYMAKENNKIVEGYRVWHDIMRRCYSEHSKDRFPAYYHICTVSEEWHNYQNFAKWFNDNKYEVNERLHIDKDILCPGNKKYCEEMCMLVPQRINMLFANKPNKRGLPNGIVQYKHGFLVKYAGEECGIKETLDEAFELYADKKKEAIINIANEYKSVIPNKLYEALLSYEVRIDVDKKLYILIGVIIMDKLVQRIKMDMSGFPKQGLYCYGETSFEANQAMQEPLEKLYKYENQPDMREKIKEYISELDAEYDRSMNWLEEHINDKPSQVISIEEMRAKTLYEVKCDLESRLEELI